MAAVSLVQRRMASSRLIPPRVLTQWVRRHVGELASMIWPTWAPESPSPMATVGLTIISSMASIDWLSPGCQSCTLPLCRRLSSIDAATSLCCVRSAWAASDLSRPRAIRGDHRETQPKCRHNARSRNPARLRLRPTRQYDRRGRPGPPWGRPCGGPCRPSRRRLCRRTRGVGLPRRETARVAPVPFPTGSRRGGVFRRRPSQGRTSGGSGSSNVV